jgi:hypothetical protein
MLRERVRRYKYATIYSCVANFSAQHKSDQRRQRCHSDEVSRLVTKLRHSRSSSTACLGLLLLLVLLQPLLPLETVSYSMSLVLLC